MNAYRAIHRIRPAGKRAVVGRPLAWGLLAAFLLFATAFSAPARAAETNYWGNPYFMGGAGSVVVSPTRDGWARFTATEAMNVSGARLYANFASSPELVVTVQSDNGSGFPDGVPLATGTITPDAAGWHDVTFGSAASLSANNVYFLVAETDTADTSFGWRFNNITDGHPNTMQPFGVEDLAWARGETTTASAASEGQSISYILLTDIGRAVGQPYISIPFQNLATTTTTYGQRFRFDQDAAGGINQAFEVTLRLNIGETKPVNPLDAMLLDADFNILTSGSIDLSEAADGGDFYTIGFNAPATLTDDELYYIGLFSNGSAGNSVQWSAKTTTDDEPLRSASFQGADAHAVSWNTQSDYAEATLTTDLNRDYYFELGVIPEPGTTLLLGAGVLILLQVRRRERRS